MLGRRFVILVIVLMGLTALAASVAPRQPVVSDDGREEPTPAPAGSPSFTRVEHEISTSGEAERVVVREGDLVDLHVSGTEEDSVRVLDRIEAIHPAAPAHFSILADDAGEFPIELVDAERRIGTLVIR